MIQVEFVGRSDRALASVDVDEDSFLVTCRFSYPDYVAPPRTTADLYGDMFNIRHTEHLLTVGDVLFVIREPDRLASIEWRAGPAVLMAGSLIPVPAAPSVFIHFIADWANDNRVAVEAPTRGIFDRQRQSLQILFGVEQNQWVTLADGIRMAVSVSGQLAALELESLPVDLCQLGGCG